MISQGITLKEKIAAMQFKKEKKYWSEKFAGNPTPSKIPYDYNGSAISSGRPDKSQLDDVGFEFPEKLFLNLARLSSGSDYNLHMILVAGLILLLQKYTGNNDIIVGTSIYKQEVEGEFVNTVLALRNNIENNMTFKELLLQVRQSMIEAVENQNYPFETLIFQLNVPFTGSDSQLFDIAILLENIQDKKYIRDINTKMVFSFLRTDESIEGVLEYHSSLYEKATMQRIVSHYTHLLAKALSNIDLNVSMIDIFSDEEIRQLLYEFNDTDKDYPGDKTINSLFEDEVEIVPHHTAVVFEESHLSYRELNNRSNQLARVLRKRGAAPDTIIGVMMEPGLEMIVVLMAVLKAGGAYLPLDVELPGVRKKYMIEEGSVSLLLSQHHVINKNNPSWKTFFPGDVLFVDDKSLSSSDGSNLEMINNSKNLAYVMFTSGSTGRPKGVMVEHGNVVNLLVWFGKIYHLQTGPNAVHVLGLTDYTFDPSIEDIFGTLLHGATLYLVRDNLFVTKEEFRNYVTRHQINLFDYVPAALKELLGEGERLKSLTAIISGGEKLEESLKDRIIGKGYTLYNNYGPTEITVDALSEKCSNKKVTLGKPMFNMKVYILDTKNNPLPIGVYGELCISGAGVSRGYLNKPGLTGEKFVSNPFIPGEKMYKTGDLGRWLSDGTVEYLGRKDQQLKIRGFRIELGEIESQLLKHPGIEKAAVLTKENTNGEKCLCAYMVQDEEITSSVSELREYLSMYLPYYMVPQYFVPLEKIPITSNGKMDRKALPDPELITGEEYAVPRDEVEEKLVDIWSEVLDIQPDKIGINSDFFELGGHSLKATTVLSRVHKELNAKANFGEVFKRSTIKEFSQYLKGLEEDKYASMEPVEKKEYYALSSAQKRLYILQQLAPQSTAYNTQDLITLEGTFERDKLEPVIKKLINRHESFRTSFEMIEEKPMQRIHDYCDVAFEIEYYDLAAEEKNYKLHNTMPLSMKKSGPVSIPNSKSQIPNKETRSHHSSKNRIIHHLFIRPFDLSQAPLMRVGLIKTGEKEHILMVDMHHIITDVISQIILAEEFTVLCHGGTLPDLMLQYKGYSEWQNSDKQKQALEQQEMYWLKSYQGEIPVLDLPIDYERPSMQSFEGSNINFVINSEQAAKLKTLALKQNATLYMVLLALYYVLLAKISGQEDIVVGTPVSGRNHRDLQPIIGMFVNTLILRNYPSAEKTFTHFLEEVKQMTLQAFDNQDYPFEELVEKLGVRRDTGRNPICDVMFAFQTQEEQGLNLYESMEVKIEPYEYENRTSKFDMVLYAVEEEHALHCNIEYSTKLFKKETIQRFSAYFKDTVTAVLQDSNVKLKDIEVSLDLVDSKSAISHEAQGVFGF